MAYKTTLNATNLETLGAARLAELLMDISEGNANAKRRLRLELAGSESPDKLANEIRKRLIAIGAATTNVGWRTLKGFRGDLNTQRRLIVAQVLPGAPDEAGELMWSFIALGDTVIERTSDASGGVIEIFRMACTDISAILTAAKPEGDSLLSRIVAAQLANSYGQNDGLIAGLAPLIDRAALLRLRDMLTLAAKEPAAPSSARPRPVKRWRKRVLAATESLRKRPRLESLRAGLLAIADALGDVDAYIALMADAYVPATAAQIADRLLRAGRAEDAMKALDGARQSHRSVMPSEWIDMRITALETLGFKAEAQSMRLGRFSQTLDAGYLRAYLKRLPDFDDIEAEDEALDQVKSYPDANAALGLLIGWPSFERAADLVVKRVAELDGNQAGALTFAADRLTSRYPLAALLLQRQIVEAALISGGDSAGATAVMPFLEAESLARHIDDFGHHGDHAAWRRTLERRYSRRAAFWKSLP